MHKEKIGREKYYYFGRFIECLYALYNELQTSYIPRNMLLKRWFYKVSIFNVKKFKINITL